MTYIASLFLPVVVVVMFVWIMIHIAEGLAGEVDRMDKKNDE